MDKKNNCICIYCFSIYIYCFSGLNPVRTETFWLYLNREVQPDGLGWSVVTSHQHMHIFSYSPIFGVALTWGYSLRGWEHGKFNHVPPHFPHPSGPTVVQLTGSTSFHWPSVSSRTPSRRPWHQQDSRRTLQRSSGTSCPQTTPLPSPQEDDEVFGTVRASSMSSVRQIF